MSHLEINEVVIVYFNVINDDYQHESKVLYTFAPLLDIPAQNLKFLQTFNSEFSYIKVWYRR